MLHLLTTHSIVRWLFVLAALALIIRLVLGLVRRQPWDKSARILSSAFTGLMDLQVLLGVLFLVLDGMAKTGFPFVRLYHAGVMLGAALLAHVPGLFFKKQPDGLRTSNTLMAVLFVLLLIAIGIRPLGGWTRWWHVTGLF